MTQEERRIIVDLRTRMEHNLKTCILPFWTRYMTDQVHGGFYGRVDGSLQPDLSSPKSMVLNGIWCGTRPARNLPSAPSGTSSPIFGMNFMAVSIGR